jgi:hypothetical protein
MTPSCSQGAVQEQEQCRADDKHIFSVVQSLRMLRTVKFGRSRTGVGVFGGEEEGSGVRSRPGGRILLVYTINGISPLNSLVWCLLTFLKKPE